MCSSLSQPVRCLYRHQHYSRPTNVFQHCYPPAPSIHTVLTSRHSSTGRGQLRKRTPIHGAAKSDDLVSDIVKGRLDHGVQIDHHGQLKIVSAEVSRQQHKTALILSRASKSLEPYDFIRLLNHRVAAKGSSGLEGGPKEGDFASRNTGPISLFSNNNAS